jgi:hypothetical protein
MRALTILFPVTLGWRPAAARPCPEANNTTNGLEMRRYIGLDILAKSRMTLIETAESEEVTLTAITA